MWFLRYETILFENRLFEERKQKAESYRRWKDKHRKLFEKDFIKCSNEEMRNPDIQ